MELAGGNLTELRIAQDAITNHYLLDAALAAIATRCSKLRVLTLDVCVCVFVISLVHGLLRVVIEKICTA